ncbi:Leucine-rich repeats and immunoglobulin-like domains protein 3 [Armadillidium nasatum]|uniref:Leucine-rich repeats and immunoglobulin-like domains protein 3 n=1 Tax=Armadillidium nasatum TaxID=96803 RepID=A0A5N5TGZ3_9CRUS|nr:Leucine-rich repeats and immunoglobulin-like domains protein 3 [Armadillidium nasatum]
MLHHSDWEKKAADVSYLLNNKNDVLCNIPLLFLIMNTSESSYWGSVGRTHPEQPLFNSSYLGNKDIVSSFEWPTLILALEDLNLEEFPDLGELPTLKRLSLSGNFLDKCERDWAYGLPKLHDLDLARNRFRNLNLSQISSDLSLRRIDLKSNLISKVFTSLSDHFPALNDLRLPRNQIDDEAFKNLTHLFDALPNLKSLDLNRNLIRRPQSLKFKNLTNLSVLKLKRNKIEELPDGLFYGLSSLTTLRLDNNTNITEISNGWLFEQRALKILSLSHNNIGIIKENAWETTTKI